MTEEQMAAVQALRGWTCDEARDRGFEGLGSWPPYPIVADREGRLYRLHFGAQIPAGYAVVGMNCARTASLERIGDRRTDGDR